MCMFGPHFGAFAIGHAFWVLLVSALPFWCLCFRSCPCDAFAFGLVLWCFSCQSCLLGAFAFGLASGALAFGIGLRFSFRFLKVSLQVCF